MLLFANLFEVVFQFFSFELILSLILDYDYLVEFGQLAKIDLVQLILAAFELASWGGQLSDVGDSAFIEMEYLELFQICQG